MVEEGIEDIQPNQLVDTNTTPKLRLKLLPKLRQVNILNKVMVNNQEDINKDKTKENGHLNSLLKRTTNPDNSTRVGMEMGVTE
jgi:membrane-associated HD superfamily phosphohydrolase